MCRAGVHEPLDGLCERRIDQSQKIRSPLELHPKQSVVAMKFSLTP